MTIWCLMNGHGNNERPAAGTGCAMSDIVRYVITQQIERIEHRDKVVKTYKDQSDPTGRNVVEDKIDLGWFVRFKGSHESLFIGADQPHTLPKPGARAR